MKSGSSHPFPAQASAEQRAKAFEAECLGLRAERDKALAAELAAELAAKSAVARAAELAAECDDARAAAGAGNE